MNIVSAGIDYHTASIDNRENFSFTKSRQSEIYEILTQNDSILGCLIVSTCNRFELFLSCKDAIEINPFKIICDIIGVDCSNFKYTTYTGESVFDHLCLLSSGVKSQIFGEEQIITQVKDSAAFARENNATDNIIEVLVRMAVTCAKKVRTEIKLTHRNTSISNKVVEKIIQNNFPIKNILVIGNGEMGRHIAKKLLENGYSVSMTIREYKNKSIELPKGATGFEYAQRYAKMHNFDALVSATLSPHFTVKYDMFKEVPNYPKYLFDLAIPRDIEKNISDLQGIHLFDVDDLSADDTHIDHQSKLNQINKYIEKYKSDFKKWDTYRTKMGVKEKV